METNKKENHSQCSCLKGLTRLHTNTDNDCIFCHARSSLYGIKRKQLNSWGKNGEPANATADSHFSLFGPHQCSVAPGVGQQL